MNFGNSLFSALLDHKINVPTLQIIKKLLYFRKRCACEVPIGAHEEGLLNGQGKVCHENSKVLGTVVILIKW